MRWQPVAALAEALEADPWLRVRVGSLRVAIAGFEGAWYAVADACTHAGCRFSEDATLEGGVIVCNCHGSEFDLRTGEVIRGPAEDPVLAYPVRVAGDRLEIEA